MKRMGRSVAYGNGGISGCHNEVNFKAQLFSNGNGGRIEIVNESPTIVSGVKNIEYKVLEANSAGEPILGQYKYGGAIKIKTVYDPVIYPEPVMKDLGYKAFKDAMDNNRFDVVLTNGASNRTFKGMANGRTIEGYYKEVNGDKVISTWWIFN
jgi:hypothetical protein